MVLRFLRSGLVTGCIQSVSIFERTLAMVLHFGLSAEPWKA